MRCARWLIGLACVGAPVVACAQLSARDSLRILAEARSAQTHFEIVRRANLPRVEPQAGHECEVVVGRMCYWNDADDPEPPRAEPREIVTARQKLLATLAQLSERSRADPWIAGQRVRYLVEAGNDSAAVVAARECWAARWWCSALLGYAEHGAAHYPEAQAAYDSALAAMPADVRCRWTDISLLLDDDVRDRYTKLPCAERATMEQRFWELARPSYVVTANDRRTEHFSRVLLAELSQDAENPYGLRWGDDLRELLIRYGAPLWYASSWPTMMGLGQGPPTPTGHDRQPSYHFAAMLEGDSVRWDVRAKRAQERYSPPYLDSLVDLDAQFVMVKRGDSALVVAVYADTARGDSTVLGVGTTQGARVVASDSAYRHVRRGRAAWKGLVAGVERFDPRTRTDARARAWIAPPTPAAGAPALSTLLLYTADTSSVETLDDALAHALTANELRGTRKLGVYWEMYGERASGSDGLENGAAGGGRRNDAASADSAPIDYVERDTMATVRADSTPTPPDVSITVARIDGGVLKWLAQTLRITQHDSPLVVQWHDARLENGVAARSVVLDLAQLPAGTYRITLAAGPDEAHQTRASREIRIR
jgi:hypothetical protein